MTKEEAKHFSDVLKAYSEGKTVEYLKAYGKWECICENPTFTRGPMYYRIKPKPKYRPYKNAEEFLKAQKEHGPYVGSTYFTAEGKSQYWLITAIYDEPLRVRINGNTKSIEELLRLYKWQDGHPMGILE